MTSTPSYWLARVAYWTWLHTEGQEDSPFFPSYQAFGSQARPLVEAIREAFASLEALQSQLLHARELEHMKGDRVAYARRVITKTMEEAAERFSAVDPDAAEWNALRERARQAREEEQRLIGKGVELEKKHGGGAMASLIKKGYGTKAYQGRGLGKWLDDRLAKRVGFSKFQSKKRSLAKRIAQAREAWEAAKREERQARTQLEHSWRERGVRYADAKAVSMAEALRQMADLTGEEIGAVRMDLERNSAQARRAAIEAVATYHRQAGELLAALVGDLAKAPAEDLEGWPDIDETAFVDTVGDRDLARTSLLQKTNQGFMGQGTFPDSSLPAWILLAYGNTRGLPGTAMAQSSMGTGDLIDRLRG